MSTRTDKVKAGIFVLVSVFLMLAILALVGTAVLLYTLIRVRAWRRMLNISMSRAKPMAK